MRPVVLIACSILALSPRPADARIIQISIARTESPTFDGTSFGDAGQYEKLAGTAIGEIDPRDPHNAIIADIQLAPTNARGMVEYSTDVIILRPRDPARGNHRVFFEINNRGDIRSLSTLNGAPSTNDPTSAQHAGTGFLMRQGYTIVASGWDVTVRRGNGRLAMNVPIARNPDGSAVVGPAIEEFVIDDATTTRGELTYPAATLDKDKATLSVRALYSDGPVIVPPEKWAFRDDRTITLVPEGTQFESGRLYEFVYHARDPLVAGLAFAGVRDLAAFLKTDPITHVYSFGVSQPTRFVHDFLHLGFNEDEQGRRVFDGMLNWIGGATGGFFNYRFAQPGRTHRQHIGRWYPEFQFPFANSVTFDPVTGQTDGRMKRCLQTRTCPNVFEVNSENEYWAKAMSLLHTDTSGHDIAEPSNVRDYLLANLPHGAARGPGICQQPKNPVSPGATLRALLVALDAWVSDGREPPASRVPHVSDGTLVPPLPQSSQGFPALPGVIYNGRAHTGDLFDYGPVFAYGILTKLPPVVQGTPYPVLVPKTDADGGDLAGIRQVEIAVPLATHTGWGLRPSGDGCDAAGQQIPFAATTAERLKSGDPRLSLEERYPTREDYVKRVADAAAALQAERLLLEEDVKRYIDAARREGIGAK